MSAKYTVRVGYVDTSYWDDGSRWTRATFKFDAQREAIEFARVASMKGCEVQGQHEKLWVHPKEDEITVERHSTTEVKWQAEPSSNDTEKKT